MSLKKNSPATLLIAASGAMAIIAAFTSQASAAKPEPKAWTLVQKHAELGEVKFYVTRDAVKATIAKTGVSMMAKAPDWRLYYYRPDERSMWMGNIEQLEPASLVNPFNRSFGRKSVPVVVKKKDVPYIDKRTEQAVEKVSSGTNNGLHYDEYSTVTPRQRLVFWLTKDIPVDHNCALVFCRFYGVPDLSQIPLYVRKTSRENILYSAELAKNKTLPFMNTHHGELVTDLRTGPQVVMSTKSCTKAAYDPSAFTVPANYKRVPAIVDVTYSGKVKDDITEIMDDMAFTSDKPHKK